MFLSFANLLRLILLILFFYPCYFFARKWVIFNFLKNAGPSFIKLGQILSTREDLVGREMAKTLNTFQDNLDPCSPKKVQKILRKEFGPNFNEIFEEFDFKAIASASIAQVHKGKINGQQVAVKILRPNIRKIMRRDIKTLKLLIALIWPFSRFFYKTLKDIANLLETTSKSELDLLREAQNATRLKEELKNVKGFYVPEIFWQNSTSNILVLEFLDGIPFSNEEKIKESNFDKKQIAKNLVISYFEQVYNNGFFHADMHPGNLFLLKNGDIGVIDFGIIGKINKKTRIAIAQILIGFLDKNYAKVAKLHIEAGLVPANTDIDDLTLSIRKIGEKIVGSNVKDIPIANLLGNLALMTKKYNMTTNPDLLLLQKTVILVEGVGVILDEDLNMWQIARPWVKEWGAQNIGFDAKIRDLILEFVDLAKGFLNKNK